MDGREDGGLEWPVERPVPPAAAGRLDESIFLGAARPAKKRLLYVYKHFGCERDAKGIV